MNVVNETRNQTYERLVKVVGESGVGGVDEGEMFEMLRIGDKPGPGGELNSGNKVTDEVKLITRVSCYILSCNFCCFWDNEMRC